MSKPWNNLIWASLLLFIGMSFATEFYKIDKGLFSSDYYMIRLDSDGTGQVNHFERMKSGAFLVQHQSLKCQGQGCKGGLFFLDRVSFQLHFGEGFLKQNVGILEKATKIEYFEALNRSGFIASTACVYDYFKSSVNPQILSKMEISFPGLAHFPDFHARSTKVEFQAEILGLLKKLLGRDFDHNPVEACIERNFLRE